MKDIIYFGNDYEDNAVKFQNEFITEVKERFPDVELTDAYDDINGHRQQVVLDDAEKDNYYGFLIGKGWYSLSLHMGVVLYGDNQKDIDRWMSIAKKEYPEAFETDETLSEA